MKRTLIKNAVIGFAVLFSFIATSAHAGIIYQNVSADNYDASSGSTIGHTQNNSREMRFTAATTEYLSYISLQLWNVSSNNIFDVELFADNGGFVDGLIAGRYGVTGAPDADFDIPLVDVFFTDSVMFTAGLDYWLKVSSNYNDTWLAWEFTPATGENGLRVIGSRAPIPEPATLVLFTLGLAGMLVRKQRR